MIYAILVTIVLIIYLGYSKKWFNNRGKRSKEKLDNAYKRMKRKTRSKYYKYPIDIDGMNVKDQIISISICLYFASQYGGVSVMKIIPKEKIVFKVNESMNLYFKQAFLDYLEDKPLSVSWDD